MKKRLLSLALCLALCLGLLPVGVLATEGGGIYVPPSTSTGGGGVYVETHPVTVISGETENGYDSIIEAFNNVDDGGTIRLNNDVTLETSLEVSRKNITLDLNGYVLGSNGSLTIQRGAALTVTNADAKKSEKEIKVGLYLKLLVEKGGSFTCTDGGLRYLGLLSAGTGDYAIQLAEGESHCTFGGFAQGDESATAGDLLKATPGMALYGDHNGSDVRIERSTRISSGFTYFSFYVGPCSEHQMDANGTCIYCGASYVASVTASGGVTTNYTSLDDALDAVKDGDTVTLLSDAAVTRLHSLSTAFTLELNGKTTQSKAELYLHARVIVQDSNTGKTGGMAGTYLLNVQEGGDLIIKSGIFNGRIAINVGKLTIEGGTFNQEVALPRGDSVFFSGGTFAKIWYPNSSGSFLDLLADGYAFYDKNGKLVNAAKITDTNLYNVRIRPHQHTFNNGACACGYTCPHTSVDESGACTVCGKQFAASITEGNDVTYYDTFNGALVYAFNNDGCTLKLLADVTGDAVMINNPFLFDLNGHNVNALSVDARATIKDSGTEKGKIGKVTVSTHKVPGLTLGDLLEEGYAFQYGNGSWANDSHLQTSDGLPVTVRKAPIQSVEIYAKDENHKEVPTIAYGTTGEVTLVSSCRMGETSGTDLSYLWYKLEGFAATAPLKGATGANYTLPDNLTAGTHTYLLICTSGGYSKSAEITITVTPVSLAGAEVTVQNPTYNGKPQEPKVTVKLGDKTLSRDNDYTMEVTKQTDAGSCKLTIKGGGNYTDEIKNVEWKIEPIKIDHVEVSSDISKTYDGTAAVTKTAEEWATALRFKTLSAYDVVSVPSDAYTISDAYFVKKNAAGAYVASPEVGKKNIQFTVTFQNNNYVLQTALDDQPASSKTYIQSGLATFTIAQATAPALTTEMMLYVTNDLAKTYEVDLKTLLPQLTKPRAYGALRYTVNADGLNRDYYTSGAAVENDKLMLPIHDVNTDQTGSIGKVVVTIASDNYEDITQTIPVFAQNKLPPDAADVTVSASDITYGQTVADSKLTVTGVMKCPRTKKEIKGRFAWTAPETKPDAAGDYTAEWTFTPAEGYEEYATATGEVAVKVNPKSIEGAKVALGDSLTYNGSEQTQAVTSVKLDETTLTAGTDYTISGNTGKDAKGYELTISGMGNYTGTATGNWSITPKTVTNPTIKLSSGPFTYTGQKIEPTVTVMDEGKTIPDSEYTVSYESNINAGTAKIIITDKENGNYTVSGNTTFTIDKAAPTYTPPMANDLTYNGTAQELFKAATTQDGTTLYSMSKTSDFLPDVPLITRAGTYTFYYQVRGDSNHTDSDIGTITVTIKKAPLTITAKDKSAYVGSTAPDLSNPELNKDYTVSGLFGRDLLTKSPVLSYATEKPDMSQIGSVDINISDADAGRNYTITYVSGKLNITTRSSSSGSSNSGTKTDTVKNPDGSTTKTETKADGSKTETTTASSGGGSTGTTVTKTDAKGNTTTEASAKLSDRDVKEAQEKGEAVTVPVKGIAAAKDANAATKIKIDVPNNANKTTVEIPVENVTSGTVAVIVHEDGTEELVKDSKPTEHGVQLELSGSTTVKIIDNSKTFDDTKDHWSRDEVNFVAARELFNGVGGNQFGVSQPMTRGMVNTVLARLADVDTTPGQGQAWYEVGTDWAKKNGISDGTNPTAPVTREQLATLLYRYAGSPDVSGTLNAADAASVSDYAEDALLWANQNGIVNGVGSNTIAPKDNAQRAQVAAMLARYLQNQ